MTRLLPLLFLGLCQCGYNWGHQSRELPGGHKTVYVELFANPTQELGLEVYFAKALMQELQRSGFAIVTNKNNAELIIKGDVLSAEVTGGPSEPTFEAKDFAAPTPTTRRYSAQYFASYSLRLSVNLRAIRSRDKKLVWQSTINGADSFRSARLRRQGLRSSNVLYNEARKKQTVRLIAQDMMNRAFDQMTENF
jgi:hypothetical protein